MRLPIELATIGLAGLVATIPWREYGMPPAPIVLAGLMGAALGVVCMPAEKRNPYTAVATGLAGVFLSFSLTEFMTEALARLATAHLPNGIATMTASAGFPKLVAFLLGATGFFVGGLIVRSADRWTNDTGWLGALARRIYESKSKPGDPQPPTGRA